MLLAQASRFQALLYVRLEFFPVEKAIARVFVILQSGGDKAYGIAHKVIAKVTDEVDDIPAYVMGGENRQPLRRPVTSEYIVIVGKKREPSVDNSNDELAVSLGRGAIVGKPVKGAFDFSNRITQHERRLLKGRRRSVEVELSLQ